MNVENVLLLQDMDFKPAFSVLYYTKSERNFEN